MNQSVKSFIVTLPDYSSRLEKLSGLQKDLSSIGIAPTFFNGVNGKDITFENTNIDHVKIIHHSNTSFIYDASVRTNNEPMTRGEFGCAWSHLNLLKQLVAEPADINYYLIMEDDVDFLKPIEELNELLQTIPADTDMCHLAKSEWYPFTKIKQINTFFYECKRQSYFNRTTAYLVSKKGAEKILTYSNNHIDIPVDDLYNLVYRTSDFRFYVSYSYFFKEQENTISCILHINKQELQYQLQMQPVAALHQ